MNVIHGNKSAPIALFINKKTTLATQLEDEANYKPVLDWNAWLKTNVLDKLNDCKFNIKV